ncbi:MAG: ComF family protein [Chlorobiaceae bacterium]|nr:ComF family protein [Chlorobiaceae bacterium]NTV60133.1 ComF family protein [Chlorobiaceae bacterium]
MLERFLHLLFPDVCIICAEPLHEGEEFCCRRCISGFDSFSSPLESGEVLRHAIASRSGGRFSFEHGWCLHRFHKGNPLQMALHSMKYEGLFTLAESFGSQLGKWMLSGGNAGGIECIVPVPLHYLKKIERSYNQAEKIARGIGDCIGKPVRPELLGRQRWTPSQTSLPAALRRKNPEGAFLAAGTSIPGHILLVDDVVTTGATMRAAAKALQNAGAERVSLAAIALAAS